MEVKEVPPPCYSPPRDTEDLPEYSGTLVKRADILVKREFTSPFRRAVRRSWTCMSVELNSTQLRLSQGSILKHVRYFSLQYAEVGLAADYEKREYALRVRIEGHQFLFAFESQQELIEWMLALQTAIGLALPLELRTIPEARRRRRHRRIRDRSSTHSSSSAQEITDEEAAAAGRIEQAVSEEEYPTERNRSDSDVSENLPEAMMVPKTLRLVESPQPDEPEEDGKWRPTRGRRRSPHHDFPLLPLNLSWEGKPVLWRGRWAVVQKCYIYIVV